jgi:hypothetical protein
MAKIQNVDINFDNVARGINTPPPTLDGDIVNMKYVVDSLKSYRTSGSAAAETSTTSTTVYSTKVTFNTPVLPLGDYEVIAYYKARVGANRTMTIRIREGASNILAFDEPFMGNVADRPKKHLEGRLLAISGVKTLTLEFKVGNTALSTSSTAYLSEAYLEIRRLYPV